ELLVRRRISHCLERASAVAARSSDCIAPGPENHGHVAKLCGGARVDHAAPKQYARCALGNETTRCGYLQREPARQQCAHAILQETSSQDMDEVRALFNSHRHIRAPPPPAARSSDRASSPAAPESRSPATKRPVAQPMRP